MREEGVLPLAAAADRLRRPAGRPRRVVRSEGALAPQAPTPEALVSAVSPVQPRLLDPESAARYLSVSYWTIRDLEAAGLLARVRLSLPGGRELRKLLYDREDLDRLIAQSKDHESLPT